MALVRNSASQTQVGVSLRYIQARLIMLTIMLELYAIGYRPRSKLLRSYYGVNYRLIPLETEQMWV